MRRGEERTSSNWYNTGSTVCRFDRTDGPDNVPNNMLTSSTSLFSQHTCILRAKFPKSDAGNRPLNDMLFRLKTINAGGRDYVPKDAKPVMRE